MDGLDHHLNHPPIVLACLAPGNDMEGHELRGGGVLRELGPEPRLQIGLSRNQA